MLYQFLVDVLIEHSGSVFIGVIMGLFGYIGWLLWQINEKLKSFMKKNKDDMENLRQLENKINEIDNNLYKDMVTKVEKNLQEMGKLKLIVNDNNKELEKMRSQIITDIKEESKEIKDIIMFLVNNGSRSMLLNVEEEKNLKKFFDKTKD